MLGIDYTALALNNSSSRYATDDRANERPSQPPGVLFIGFDLIPSIRRACSQRREQQPARLGRENDLSALGIDYTALALNDPSSRYAAGDRANDRPSHQPPGVYSFDLI